MTTSYNYNVDDYGVLRVYGGRSNTILFEAQDFLNTPRKEIEDFIEENLKLMEKKNHEEAKRI